MAKLEAADRDSLESWNSEDQQPFPMYLIVPIILIYLILCGVVVSVFDKRDDLNPGLTFGDSFYFSFISVSTIGLGDVLPNHIEYSPLMALMFLFGLALLSVVNTTIYEALEKKLMNGVEKMEAWLESVHYHRHGREGYMVFKTLGPNIQLLALALPLFDDYKEDQIEAILDPGNTMLGKRLFPNRLSRTRSLQADIDNFRPTMGVLHISSGPKRSRAATLSGSLPIHDPAKNPRRNRNCSLIPEENSG
jgi:hypothetical protein